MLLDANLLLFAANARAPEQPAASAWLTAQLNGPRRVGLPWQSLGAFLRIATNPRLFPRPLRPAVAWRQVEEWLSAPAAWVPTPGDGYAGILKDLVEAHAPSGNLGPDAMLAALAIEHGVTLCSSDTDFARFAALRWENPLV